MESGLELKAAIRRSGEHVRDVLQRDENRGKSAILKRTSRGPGTEIAAARTKSPTMISRN